MSQTSATNLTSTSGPNNQPAKKPAWRWPLVIGLLVLIMVGAVVGVAYASQSRTIVRNVKVGDQHLGGLDTLTALSELEQRWRRFSQQAFVFVYQDERVALPVVNASASEEEVVLDLASLDPQRSVDQAYDYGHTGPRWQQAWERLLGWLGQTHRVAAVSLDQTTLRGLLKQRFGQHDQPATNAGLTVHADGTFDLAPSRAGQIIDYQGALRQALARLQALDPTPVTLTTAVEQPTIAANPNLEQLARTTLPGVLAKAPIALTFEPGTWQIDQPQLQAILGFVKNGNQIRIGFDAAKTNAFFDVLRQPIDIKPRDAKFKVTAGRVEEFQTSVVGRSLNATATLAALDQAVFVENAKTVALVVDEIKPLTDTVTTNDLGIKELVAEGITNFRGSPPNRIFNLSLGAERLNGILIKPGEVFSLVEALGPIDQAHGWKPELVIKGTEITPEYGGGLCQVATTLFRAALNTGLPILERKNHSLRISYYEPPIGLDATVYEPKPDLKFKNDYAIALLLQTRVEGTQLIFSFYGTKDGRTVTIPEPKVFNRVAIPPTQKTEVDDLPPGVEECQAPGHPGADAIATYTVTKADGTSVTQEFKSHYRALPVICRVGKSSAPAPKPTNTNTNTANTNTGST